MYTQIQIKKLKAKEISNFEFIKIISLKNQPITLKINIIYAFY